MFKLSFTGKRTATAAALVLTLLALVNYHFELGLVGQFSKNILVVSVGLLIAVLLFIGPTAKEMQDYRDAKRHSKRK